MKKHFLLSIACVTFLLVSAQLPQISLVQLATGYIKPLDIKNCGDQRLFVVEQTGYIRVLYKNGTKQTTPFLDIDARVNSSGDEQGLLGLAFSPNYKQDGYFYVNYIFGSGNGSTRVSRFSVMANDSSQANPNSEVVLLTFTQPATNHNGGNMMFGPDGYLYISQGDGGSANDPQGNGQNRNTFHGKMLRIDVTGQTTYAVPPTNPLVGIANTKPEIWAYGLRNPWRASFDRLTGDMWIGDVGQGAWEEVDFQDASSAGGENYGWRCREGFHACPGCNLSGCTGTGYTDPIYEVPSTTSCSVTGGYVYRGTQYGKFFGLYIFTDYCSGRFWSIKRLGPTTFDVDTLQDLANYQYTSLGEDNLGELYIAYRGDASSIPPDPGKIYRIVEPTDCKPAAFITFADTIIGCKPVALTALRGDTLSYQWYNSAGLINGANSYQYAAQQSGWYKVKVSKQQVNCEAMSDSVYVTALDTTAITRNSMDTLICISEPQFIMNNYTNPVGGGFSGNGVVFGTFDAATAGVGVSAITYTYFNVAGCESRYAFNLHVGDATALAKNVTDSVYCSNESAFALNGFIAPGGGIFSGPGVTGNNFDPAVPSLGLHTIMYDYTNSFGCVSSDSFQLRVDICSGINEVGKELSFSIFPNPTNGTFSLSVNVLTIQDADLIITDAIGKVCFRKTYTLDLNNSSIFVELPNLAKGVYSVQLKGEKAKGTGSLIIK